MPPVQDLRLGAVSIEQSAVEVGDSSAKRDVLFACLPQRTSVCRFVPGFPASDHSSVRSDYRRA